MLKLFSLQFGETDPVVEFNIFNFIVTNGYICNNLTEDGLFRITLFFYWLRISQDQATRAKPEAFKSHKQPFSYEKIVNTGPSI